MSLRLLLLVKYEVKSYLHIFFTVKNSLVLLLIVYRMFVLFENRHNLLSSSRETLNAISLDDVTRIQIAKVRVVGGTDRALKEEPQRSTTNSSFGDSASLADL